MMMISPESQWQNIDQLEAAKAASTRAVVAELVRELDSTASDYHDRAHPLFSYGNCYTTRCIAARAALAAGKRWLEENAK